MKEIFGNEILDGCIRVMLQTGEERAYFRMTNFIKSIPATVMNEIRSNIKKYEKENIVKEQADTFNFCGGNAWWELKYGDNSFELKRRSIEKLQEKAVLSVEGFNEVFGNIVYGKLEKNISEYVGTFRTEKPRLIGPGSNGFEYDFWVETTLLFKKFFLATEITKIEGGAFNERSIDKEIITKSSLNLEKCWSKEAYAKMKEEIIDEIAKEEEF